MTGSLELRRDPAGVAPPARGGRRLGARCRVLLVPGFVADTYSEIERSYVELAVRHDPDVEYIWLIPHIGWRHNRFARPEKRHALHEPVWVPPLLRHGVRCVVGDIAPYDPLANFRLFRRVFRQYPIDVVYTHFGYERFWAAFFGKLFGKRIVWNEHWHSLGTRYPTAKRLFYRLFVDEFIAVSGFIAARLPPGCRVHTVPNAIRADALLLGAERALLRRRAGVNDTDTVVLMVAAFRPEKRHDLALAVSREVLKRSTGVVFLFLGAGEGRTEFLATVQRLGLGERIRAPGHVDNVDDYYALADICMLTSLDEPFGYVVLEAMRNARPVVAFGSGGPAEVIRDGETGYLIAPGDVQTFAARVVDLVNDPERRHAVGRAARHSVREQFNRDVWIERINRLLREAGRMRRSGATHSTRAAL